MRLTRRPTRGTRLKIVAGFIVVVMVAAACSDEAVIPPPPQTVVLTSIVEVRIPGPTVTSIVTQTSIVEILVTTTVPPPDPRADWPGTLVFGIVADGATHELEDDMRAFAEAMGDALDIRVVGTVIPTEANLASAIGEGSYDIGAFSPTGFLLASEATSGLELLAQSVRFGDPTYHAQWFTNDPSICGSEPVEGAFDYDEDGNVIAVGSTDSPAIQVGWTSAGERDEAVEAGLRCPSPVDLSVVVGKTVALTTETSAIGFIFPTLQLRQAGITSDQYDTKVTGGHDFSVAAVYEGTADIGVSFDDARRAIQVSNPDVGSTVIVYNITPRIANDVFVLSEDLPLNLKEEIFEALLRYIRTAAGQPVMRDLFGWTDVARADTATGQSLRTVADAMRELGFTE